MGQRKRVDKTVTFQSFLIYPCCSTKNNSLVRCPQFPISLVFSSDSQRSSSSAGWCCVVSEKRGGTEQARLRLSSFYPQAQTDPHVALFKSSSQGQRHRNGPQYYYHDYGYGLYGRCVTTQSSPPDLERSRAARRWGQESSTKTGHVADSCLFCIFSRRTSCS